MVGEREEHHGLRPHRQKRRRAEMERRTDLERRQYTKENNAEDRRTQSDRRKGGDRRAHIYGAPYTTADSVCELEDWLKGNCEGTWSMVIEELADEKSPPTYLVMFELESDKQNFKAMTEGKDK